MKPGHVNGSMNFSAPPVPPFASTSSAQIEWDWDIEHEDRKKERKADAALHAQHPFEVDRRVLKDVVMEKLGAEVGRIIFLSSGTFHKAYLVLLSDGRQVVARVARRFMSRLKTESEVATMHYLREHTSIPVPMVYFYDSNPYNRLGGEYILMSKAPGIPLSKVYHTMPHNGLVKLLHNIASLLIPLFSHRFSHLGSLYFDKSASVPSSAAPTPKAAHASITSFPFMSSLSMSSITSEPEITPKLATRFSPGTGTALPSTEVHVGPIISWPFFGSNRGELTHPTEINRGPWPSTHSYLLACAEREIKGVIRENEGKAAPHKLHLDPDEIISSRHHHLRAVPGDKSDDSDEWELEESEEEWEGPGDVMYRDYRRMQRSTFLVAHMVQREEFVRAEMGRWMGVMEKLGIKEGGAGKERFGLDLHDLSLENIFVDENDHSNITCIIDWESTTTRPLWACAHLPAFLQSSPFTADLFRDTVSKLASNPSSSCDIQAVAREWLHYEASGAPLRLAHRFVEWDGWEEGLVDSILGSEEHEDEWFQDQDLGDCDSSPESSHGGCHRKGTGDGGVVMMKRRKQRLKLPFEKETEKERVLDMTGDECGGRGGELGRRLEALLSVDGDGDEDGDGGNVFVGATRLPRWEDDEKEYEAEAE